MLKNKLILGSLFSVLFFSILVFIYNFKAIQYNCFNSNDIGIYGQALHKLSHFKELNPFITVRGQNIFNDHFDPILFLVASSTQLFHYHYANLIIIELLWFLATFISILICLERYSTLTSKKILCLSAAFIFNRAFSSALLFPIHPTTWAMFPMFLLSLAILRKDTNTKILFAAFFLCLFREEFSFAILSLSFFYFLKRKLKLSLSLFSISTLFIAFTFWGRRYFWGEVESYGSNLLAPLFFDPINSFQKIFSWERIQRLKIFLPFLVFLGGYKKIFFHPLLFLFLPLFLIRLLSGFWDFHYSAPIIPIILTPLFFSKTNFSTKKTTLFYLSLFLINISQLKKMITYPLLNNYNSCSIYPEKVKETEELINRIKRLYLLNPQEKLLSTGGIIPQLLSLNKDIYHLGNFQKNPPFFDSILIEINNSGNTWPISSEKISKIVLYLKSDKSLRIVFESKSYLLFKGRIDLEHLKLIINS